MLSAASLIGTHDVLLITLDTLRYDVAESALAHGRTPNIARLLPGGRWERRHAPGSFTYASHSALFAGFLPTPARPGKHPRLFAARFPGSETTSEATCVFDEPNIVAGLAARGYRTICIGGVGFFNKQSPLGSVLPGLFQESYWSEDLGVTSPDSTERQVALACERLAAIDSSQRVFLFLNVSALHQPNCIYAPPATEDTPATQESALAYVDRSLPPLFAALARRGRTLCLVMSDHGTAYGEEGYFGHRLAHDIVWTVPYAEFVLPAAEGQP
jgi:arylsulfatase A-like enzyme